MIIYNKKEFLLPDSPNSMACFHAKIEHNVMKLSIHDCNTSIRLKNDLNDPEEVTEALRKLGALASAIIELQDFIYQNYQVK